LASASLAARPSRSTMLTGLGWNSQLRQVEPTAERWSVTGGPTHGPPRSPGHQPVLRGSVLQHILDLTRRNGTPMSVNQIRNVIRRAYLRAGITSTTGTHALRHTRARSLYESGASLKLIADILGHKSIDTSRVYVSVGIQQLRSVACPWPEAATHE